MGKYLSISNVYEPPAWLYRKLYHYNKGHAYAEGVYHVFHNAMRDVSFGCALLPSKCGAASHGTPRGGGARHHSGLTSRPVGMFHIVGALVREFFRQG